MVKCARDAVVALQPKLFMLCPSNHHLFSHLWALVNAMIGKIGTRSVCPMSEGFSGLRMKIKT